MARRHVLLDVDDESLRTALAADWGDRARMRSARGGPDAVDVVASLAPGVLVVAPGVDDGDGQLALRTRWWAMAAELVAAHVVLVSHVDVFDPVEASPPDEFTTPTAVSDVGRHWRGAEAAVRAVGGGVVRHDPACSVGVAALADLVAWVARGRHGGTWHVGGDTLDDWWTRAVRADTSAPGQANGGVDGP